jgi:uncharacterized repeat protein (TIGR03806 family)
VSRFVVGLMGVAVVLCAACGRGAGPAVSAHDAAVDAARPDAPASAIDVAEVTPDRPAAPAQTGNCTTQDLRRLPAKLSETGCVDPQNPRAMAAKTIPYQVNSPLWSDGALKTRAMLIPAGAKIHVKDCARNVAECCVPNPDNKAQCLPPADDGKWVLPVGTIMLKTFLFPDQRAGPGGLRFVETRLFARLDEQTWAGYGYQWNEAQTDATLVDEFGVEAAVTVTGADGAPQTISWLFPSRDECTKCHLPNLPVGGSVLGLETAQLNRVVAGRNQLDDLEQRGLFDAPLARPFKAALAAPYPDRPDAPAATEPLALRARSYLHANCAFCHRPEGNAYNMDLRYDVTAALKNAHVCNEIPAKGRLGVDGANILMPGVPEKSVLLLRMRAAPTDAVNGNQGRMPPFASAVIDASAVKLIGDWITSIPKACP